MPLTGDAIDDHELATRLTLQGKLDQALQLELSPQFRIRLLIRGFQWRELGEPAVQALLVGDDNSAGQRAARAVLCEYAGDRPAAQRLWRQALDLPEAVMDSTEEQTQLETAAILQTLGDVHDAAVDSSAYHQLLLALLLSGRAEALEAWFAKQSPAAAFEFLAVRSDYAAAFRQIGLEPDLSNFADLENRPGMRQDLLRVLA